MINSNDFDLLEVEQAPDESSTNDHRSIARYGPSGADDMTEVDVESLPEYDNVPHNQSTVGRPIKHLRGHRSQPRLAVPVQGSGAPPPMPLKYKVVTDCDPCGALDGIPCETMRGGKNPLMSFLEPIVVSTSNPNVNVNPPACEVDNCDGKVYKRKTWGIPMS